MLRVVPFSLLVLFLTLSCSKSKPIELSIATNPWPGYEVLYLAEAQGFFQQQGLSVRLVSMASLSDSYRAYLAGQTNGFSSTIVELVQASVQGARPLQIGLITDYSNGGDEIIAVADIKNVSDLKGRKVGCEVTGLGLFVLYRALQKAGLSVHDVELINVEQLDAVAAMQSGEIDAFVTYPPVSIELKGTQGYHSIFNSSEVPGEIIDLVAIDRSLVRKHPELPQKLKMAWQSTLDYVAAHPEKSFDFMASREQLSSAEFQNIFNEEIHILNSSEMEVLLKQSDALNESARGICSVLAELEHHQLDCSALTFL